MDGKLVPYWQAGPAFAPWAGGFVGGGLLPGLLVGFVLGGALGGFGLPEDTYAADVGDLDDFGGGDFGGGDFGGGDFGGGDFGGGDFGAATSAAATFRSDRLLYRRVEPRTARGRRSRAAGRRCASDVARDPGAPRLGGSARMKPDNGDIIGGIVAGFVLYGVLLASAVIVVVS